MTNRTNVYRIKNTEDIALIPVSEPIQLEVYLKNAVIPLQNIVGNCLIRATGCSFPNLKTIKGNLSIDAADVRLPQLTFVGGYCNVHEQGIELPKLQKVSGILTILKPIYLPELEIVGSTIKNKARAALPKLKSSAKTSFEIKSMADTVDLPKDGCFALTINGNDIRIDNEEITGIITIKGSNIHFPNLHTSNTINIEESNGKDRFENISFPNLQLVQGGCVVKAKNVLFPALVEVTHQLYIDSQGTGSFPKLEKVRHFWCRSLEKITFPNLQHVDKDFRYESHHTTHSDSKDYLYPKLEEIKGIMHFKLGYTKLHNLKEIHTLEVSSYNHLAFAPTLDAAFPAIETIKYAVYKPELQAVVHKITHLFFKVLDNILVSPTEFILESRMSNVHWTKLERRPLTTLISILKMRHSSFQNFCTREFEREWLKPHDRINEVLRAIENKWAATPRFTFEDIFTFEDLNLRRYCFLYIGVSEMMTALGAKRIASKGIELTYFKYDTLGNKSKFTKHNIFEVYEAEAGKLQGLRSWRVDKVYAVKCWCTSTNHEHWLWIEGQYKDDPLQAIASTFRIHENVIPHIKCLKRQGDVLICEMKKEVIPEGIVRPLTKNEYFSLLEAES